MEKEVIFLIFDAILYGLLLFMIQWGYFQKLMNVLVITLHGTSVTHGRVLDVGDKNVQREKAAVDRVAFSLFRKFG